MIPLAAKGKRRSLSHAYRSRRREGLGLVCPFTNHPCSLCDPALTEATLLAAIKV